MTSFPDSKRARIPVSTGRDSSRDAARPTRPRRACTSGRIIASPRITGGIAGATCAAMSGITTRPCTQRADIRTSNRSRSAGLLKTLGPSNPDEGYRKTREFYSALGFLPLEETTAFWGPEQPTLVMVKVLPKRLASCSTAHA